MGGREGEKRLALDDLALKPRRGHCYIWDVIKGMCRCEGNLIPWVFPFKKGWGGPTHFFKGKALGTGGVAVKGMVFRHGLVWDRV